MPCFAASHVLRRRVVHRVQQMHRLAAIEHHRGLRHEAARSGVERLIVGGAARGHIARARRPDASAAATLGVEGPRKSLSRTRPPMPPILPERSSRKHDAPVVLARQQRQHVGHRHKRGAVATYRRHSGRGRAARRAAARSTSAGANAAASDTRTMAVAERFGVLRASSGCSCAGGHARHSAPAPAILRRSRTCRPRRPRADRPAPSARCIAWRSARPRSSLAKSDVLRIS